MSFNCGNLLALEKSVGGGREKLGGCVQDMSPGAAVGEEHAGNVERAASVAIAQDACAILPSVDAAQDPCHRLRSGVRDDNSRQLRRKKALDVRGSQHKAAFNVVAWNAKAPRLDDGGHAAAQTALCQSRRGMQCLLELIGTNRNELNVGSCRRAGDRDCALLEASDRLRAVEDGRHRSLRGDKAANLCVGSIDASQRFKGGVGIDRESTRDTSDISPSRASPIVGSWCDCSFLPFSQVWEVTRSGTPIQPGVRSSSFWCRAKMISCRSARAS